MTIANPDLALAVEYRVLKTTAKVADAAFAAYDESIHARPVCGWRNERDRLNHQQLNQAAADAWWALQRFEREHVDVVKAESETAR